MPSRGMALRNGRSVTLPHSKVWAPSVPSQVPTVLADYIWGSPPSPTQIPYSWLKNPAMFRAETMVNVATINQFNGITATVPNSTSVSAYGERAVSGTLSTACDADPAQLATWLTTYRGDPRMRQPALALVALDARTPDECVKILRVREGDRVQIIGAPATWPQGASSLVVEGVAQVQNQGVRTVAWVTSAVPGSVAGTPGPWFRWGSSVVNGTDVIPF